MEIDSPKTRVLDGYRLIRFLGRGGFGEVWLCRSEAMGDYRAIKLIPASSPELLEKEYESLLHYRKAAARLRSPHLVLIEHINRNDAGLYYVMPLADGVTAHDPSDRAWQPLSLAGKIHSQAEKPTWFSSREIISMVRPILQALQTLSDAGLVHRDVKPENILFFNGEPCLGDISLLGADASMITRRGTPGYATPSWYVGGHPDMYGAAATLYTLLTGNSPDKMGRAAFLWPPQGESSLSEAERAEWKRLHAVIRRATDEKVSERFVDFVAMASAVFVKLLSVHRPATHRAVYALVATAAGLITGFLFYCQNLHVQRTTGSDKVPTDRGPVNLPASPGDPGMEAFESETNDSTLTRKDEVYNAVLTALPRVQEHPSFDDDKNDIFIDLEMKATGPLETGDYRSALEGIELLTQALPHLAKIPLVKLSRLLLLQCNGNQTQVDREIADPSLVEPDPGDSKMMDSVDCRVDLFRAIKDLARAEVFLTNLINKPMPGIKSDLRMLRAEVRAEQGNLAGFCEDRDAAKAALPVDPPNRVVKEYEWRKLEKRFHLPVAHSEK